MNKQNRQKKQREKKTKQKKNKSSKTINNWIKLQWCIYYTLKKQDVQTRQTGTKTNKNDKQNAKYIISQYQGDLYTGGSVLGFWYR